MDVITNKAVIEISTESGIKVLTDENVVFFLGKNLEVQLQKDFKVNEERREDYTKKKAISKKYFAYIESFPDLQKVILLNLVTGEKKELYSQKVELRVLKFSSDEKYLAVGDTAGNIKVIEIFSKKILEIENKKIDEISNLMFFGEKIFISSLDCKSRVFNLKTKEFEIENITTPSVIIDSIFIGTKIFAITKNVKEGNGYFVVIGSNFEVQIKRKAFHFIPTSICKVNEKIAVSTRGNEVKIFDQEGKELGKLKTKKAEIQKIAFVDERLFIGFKAGYLDTVDSRSGINQYQLAMEKEDLEAAKKLLTQNPLLVACKEFEPLDGKWADAFEKALKFLEENKVKEAENAIKPFVQDPEKKAEYLAFFHQRGSMLRVMQGKNSILKSMQKKEPLKSEQVEMAFKMIQEKDFLKKSPSYKILAKIWSSYFLRAKNKLPDKQACRIELTAFESTKGFVITKLLEKQAPFNILEAILKRDALDKLDAHLEKFPYTEDPYEMEVKKMREAN